MNYERIEEVMRDYLVARAKSAEKARTKRGFDARFLASGSSAVEEVLQIIPQGSEIGCGGSVTLRQLGLLDRLRARGDTVLAHEEGMEFIESLSVRKKAIASPY